MGQHFGPSCVGHIIYASGGDQFLSEAEMWHTTISKEHGSHHTFVAELWILAAVIAMVALGDALAVSALAVAFVMAAWWTYLEVGHRLERKHAEVAPVSQIRVAFTGQRDLETGAAWHGPRAA
jgi:hypothetical protein